MAHTLPFETWILSLESISDVTTAIALDNGALHLLDVPTATPSLLRSPAPGPSKTALARWDDHCFFIVDGDAVSLMDTRTKAAQARPRSSKCPYASVACQPTSHLVALGSTLVSSDALVEIWDTRNDKPLHTYTDLHSDEITSLAFHRASQRTLLTGSTDGLFSVVDCSIADEDDAVLGVGNVGASLKSATWLTDLSPRSPVFSLTDMDTAGLFTSEEPELITDYGDLRQTCPIPHWKPDYTICATSRPDQSIDLFLGSHLNGTMHIKVDQSQHWSVQRHLTGHHLDGEIVRAAVTTAGVLITGGEDGRVVLWPMASPETVEAVTDKAKKKSKRYQPY